MIRITSFSVGLRAGPMVSCFPKRGGGELRMIKRWNGFSTSLLVSAAVHAVVFAALLSFVDRGADTGAAVETSVNIAFSEPAREKPTRSDKTRPEPPPPAARPAEKRIEEQQRPSNRPAPKGESPRAEAPTVGPPSPGGAVGSAMNVETGSGGGGGSIGVPTGPGGGGIRIPTGPARRDNPPPARPAYKPECGNAKLDDGEECDDGNRANGDGCSSGCRREADRNKLLAEYRDAVIALVERNKQYPASARRRGAQGVAGVRFIVAADGSISGVEMSRPSGHEALDAAALDAVTRTGKLPPLPQGIGADRLKMSLSIVFRLE